VYDSRSKVYDSRSKVYDSRSKVYDSRSKVYDSRSKVYDSPWPPRPTAGCRTRCRRRQNTPPDLRV